MLTLTLEMESWAHRLPVWSKFLALFVLTILIFPLERFDVLLICFTGLILLHLSLGVTASRYALELLRPIFFICLIIFVFHLVTQRVGIGAMIVGKIILLVGFANFVTMTSRLQEVTDMVMRALSPLKRFGVNTKLISFAFVLVVRFTPVLLSKGKALMEAWRARSKKRVNWKVAIPLVVLAIDEADHVSEALRARGGLNE